MIGQRQGPFFRCAMPGSAGYYIGSRDAKDISCHATGCKWNMAGKCGVPSQCKINATGGCDGFEAKKMPEKIDGD